MTTIIATAGSNKCGPASAIDMSSKTVTKAHVMKLIVLAIFSSFFLKNSLPDI
jgi:hypothetical protein